MNCNIKYKIIYDQQTHSYVNMQVKHFLYGLTKIKFLTFKINLN